MAKLLAGGLDAPSGWAGRSDCSPESERSEEWYDMAPRYMIFLTPLPVHLGFPPPSPVLPLTSYPISVFAPRRRCAPPLLLTKAN